MKSILYPILYCVFLVLLSACQAPTNSVQKLVSAPLKALENNSDIAGKVAKPIRYQQQEYWLLSSETLGVLLTDKKGNQLSSVKGHIELLDWRDNIQVGDQTFGLIAALDSNLGQVLIIKLDWKTKKLSELTRFKRPSAQIESLCWYQMPQGHLSLFTTDALGQVAQRIVVDATQHVLTDLVVQTFIGAPQTKSCAVDDRSQSLYIAEENIGVWRYIADHESELARELVIATQPHGPINSEVTYIEVLDSGDLLVSAPEQQGVWLVDIHNNDQARFVSLEGSHTPESVSALQQGDQLTLGIFDDETAKYFTSELIIPKKAKPQVHPSMPVVQPYAQSTAMAAYGDAADDPAIWINFADSAKSRVLGTNKKQGLKQYDLQGNLLQELNVGRVNNVDIRYGMELGGKLVDIATASNRSTKSISVFSIEPDTGYMVHISDIQTAIDDVYGLCMYANGSQYYVFVNGTDGHFQQYLLQQDAGNISGKLVREFYAPSQPEGCVVDDQNQQLYYGEEAIGVWQVSAEPIEEASKLIIKTNQTFVADVEGMGIYRYKEQRFLFASSQGNDSYGVFALDKNNQYLGSFKIGMNISLGLDGASETDGLAITSYPLGANLPAGLLVVQDGRNRLPMAPQNFKLVDARQVQGLIDSWLEKR
ncbi:phytase [Paraglaciecola arctica]|uniref:3-phytase n=1 Tax=Paraglaciecola arctica BSs20135 TaxID=493475 RepID=K6YYV8_9ALTE|nr:phytase [Paraglaciecola arctica]GAC21938.1 3-phytase [Paraglaciecola arctica BSs20135]